MRRIVRPTAYTGTPHRLQRMSMAGAWPSSAKPYSVREAIYTQDEPHDRAEVMMMALITDGKTCMPARWKAMTKGACEAVPVEIERFLSVYGLFVFHFISISVVPPRGKGD